MTHIICLKPWKQLLMQKKKKKFGKSQVSVVRMIGIQSLNPSSLSVYGWLNKDNTFLNSKYLWFHTSEHCHVLDVKENVNSVSY